MTFRYSSVGNVEYSEGCAVLSGWSSRVGGILTTVTW